MASFIVEGNHRLHGEITPQGAKNEALQVICATLLTTEEVIIENVPNILDVNNLINLLADMGVHITKKNEIPMKDLANEAGIDKKETGIALGWLRQKNWAQIDKGKINITDMGKEFSHKPDVDERVLEYLKVNAEGVKLFTDDLRDGFLKLTGRKNILNIKKETSHSFKILPKGWNIVHMILMQKLLLSFQVKNTR